MKHSIQQISLIKYYNKNKTLDYFNIEQMIYAFDTCSILIPQGVNQTYHIVKVTNMIICTS